MRQRLRHRGPDGEGLYLGSHAGLAHTRLALLDRARGSQPLTSPDGRFTLVYNGEVYNYPELRSQLRDRWDFRTACDTEVVLAAYVAWGESCLDRFNGMFAFFIWDEHLQRGFAARDRLGVKPFVYRAGADAFLFASEAKAILAALDTLPRAHVDSVLEYLTAPCFSGVEHGMFEGIDHLPAGHALHIDRHGIQVFGWWDYHLEPDRERAAPALAEELRGQLETAVALALRADDPPGVFLSGGLDSTALAALARRRLADGPRCFTIRYAGQADFDYTRSAIVLADDFPHAVEATRALDVPCTTVEVDRTTLAADLQALAVIDDALPAWEQELSQYHLSRAASRFCKSVLVGDAADETHFGYHFLLDEEATCSPAGIIRRFRTPLIRRDRLADPVGHFTDRYRDLCARAGHCWDSPEQRILATTYLIVKRWLGRLLHNGDIHTMAWSLEARVPFGDRELLDLARRIPPHLGMACGEEKWLLRESLRGVVPEMIRCRKKSALPKDQRTEEVYRREAQHMLQEEAAFLGAFLDLPAAVALAVSPGLSEAERAALFRIICLGHWSRHYGVRAS
jgi:asparagine synthase (glutamine-hydrolysing)